MKPPCRKRTATATTSAAASSSCPRTESSSRGPSCEGTRRYDHGFPAGRRSAHVCGTDRALGGNAAAALVRRVLQCNGTRLTRRRGGSWVFRRQQSTLAVRAHRPRRSFRVGVGNRCAIVVDQPRGGFRHHCVARGTRG